MRRIVRRIAAAGAAALLGVSVLSAHAASGAQPAGPAPMVGDRLLAPRLHLVTMIGPGTAGYRGPFSEDDYRTGLLRRQDASLAAVGAGEPLVRWTTALSGMAVELDPLQADRLRSLPGVDLVEVDQVRPLAGLRASSVAAAPKPRRGGAGTVIGFVDSGLDSSGPAFAETTRLGSAPSGFTGECTDAACNDKVVALTHFIDAFGADNLRSGATVGAHDDQGHGTMVAALAAGNPASPTGPARRVAKKFAGAAPDARVAVYKACWEAPDPSADGCASADVVSAIDAAVGDGVDVLNLSVAGKPGIDAVDRALLGAAESDVVVIAAAGNGGGVTGHDAPWVTTVGAVDTADHAGVLVLDDGTRLPGTLSPAGLRDERELVLARSIPAPGVTRERAERCESGALDAAGADGRLVVCERGDVPRLEKSRTVRLAGGDGMILINGRDEELTADLHTVPTLNLTARTGKQLQQALARGTARARLVAAEATAASRSRALSWSARGTQGSDLVKPDLMAPGLGRLSATTAAHGRWDLLSGTSAAAAEASGIAAAMRARHPDWSAARIRSALSTSATGTGTAAPRDATAGQIDRTAARHPGLVLDVPLSAWRAWADGELGDLNLPSAALTGTGEVRRRLTNVRARAAYWSVSVTGFDDARVQVFPQALQLAPGESAEVRIVITGAPRAGVDSGVVVWRNDAGTTVQLPVTVSAD